MKLMVGSGVYKCPFKMVFFTGTCSFSKGGYDAGETSVFNPCRWVAFCKLRLTLSCYC